MAFDQTLGLSLAGTQLPPLPPNASKDQQTTVLNEIINLLNNFSRDIVGTGVTSLGLSSESAKVVTVPHNLGYVPQAFVYIENTTNSAEGITYPGVNVPLPCSLDNGSDGSGHFLFVDWLDYFVDATNLYIRFQSGNIVTTVSPFVLKYFFTRNPVT